MLSVKFFFGKCLLCKTYNKVNNYKAVTCWYIQYSVLQNAEIVRQSLTNITAYQRRRI